ncbi:MAG: tRNA (guanine37-N1)-methyltransferase [Clostridiales bacterium]|nr:tRNA (guanine37-N1)-methyltransferase [Clostridiales bacterium]MDN5299630.1 tRNA (guanine37-N1)-methyltransferase [Clostridiales bacterium]
MKFRILTLFPEQFESFAQTSIIGNAVRDGHIEISCTQIRDYSESKHRSVDDAPFGGGQGMVMQVQPLKDALHSEPIGENAKVIYLSPRGKTLTHEKVVEMSELTELILVCGHYEGVDQRFIDTYVDEEISIGDYVLTGGELAAMVVVDSVSRLIPGVLRDANASLDESFASGLLEYPQYTRPAIYDEMEVPAILRSGNHAEIEYWRLVQALEITKARRPDLHDAFMKREHDEKTRRMLKKYLKTKRDNGII